jgi:hypothetical protein
LLSRAPFGSCRIVSPDARTLDVRRLSPWQRRQAQWYDAARRLPGLRFLLGLVGPSFQASCSNPRR